MGCGARGMRPGDVGGARGARQRGGRGAGARVARRARDPYRERRHRSPHNLTMETPAARALLSCGATNCQIV
eukprot:724821-Prymnesium_polylepis.1